MSPPYVISHRRILETWSHHDDDGRAAIGISVATPHPVGIDSVLGWRCRGWSRNNTSGKLHLDTPIGGDRLSQPRHGLALVEWGKTWGYRDSAGALQQSR